jgi:CheY-like chemotaxis protein
MKKKTVLMIEDNEFNMILARDLLQFEDFTVVDAYDAEAGIRKAHETKPDLILMDIQLPGMDGLAATRIIKKDPALREIPVVALTACAMKEDKKQAIAAGCIGYIPKPIDTRSFVKVVAQFIADYTL